MSTQLSVTDLVKQFMKRPNYMCWTQGTETPVVPPEEGSLWQLFTQARVAVDAAVVDDLKDAGIRLYETDDGNMHPARDDERCAALGLEPDMYGDLHAAAYAFRAGYQLVKVPDSRSSKHFRMLVLDAPNLPMSERRRLTELLGRMRKVTEQTYWTFFNAGIGTECHAFIEFNGVLSKYVDLCQAAHEAGIDFTKSNEHNAEPLHAAAHDMAYLGEKLGCIFGPTLRARPELRKAFLQGLFGTSSEVDVNASWSNFAMQEGKALAAMYVRSQEVRAGHLPGCRLLQDEWLCASGCQVFNKLLEKAAKQVGT